MSSDNPSGADNQQERPSPSNWLDAIPPDLGHYVAGFVDGEGSFNVPIRRERDRGERPRDRSPSHGARPVRTPSLAEGNRGRPHHEGSDEPRRKASPNR